MLPFLFSVDIALIYSQEIQIMFEHFFQCPYCWEEISMLLDSSIVRQTYVEDCEVCCNPIQITSEFQDNKLMAFEALDIEQ